MKKEKLSPFSRTARAAKAGLNGVTRKIGRIPMVLKYFFWGVSRTLTTYFIGLSADWSKPTYESMARKAVRNPYAWRAVELVSTSIASVAKNLYVEVPGPDGQFVADDNHPLINLLGNPRNECSMGALFEIMTIHLFLGGEVLMWNLGLMGQRSFNPTRISLIRPDRMTYVERNQQTLEIVRLLGVDMYGRGMAWPIDEVLFIKKYDPLNDDRGLPLLLRILQALDIFDDQMEWAKSISQHKGRIPGWFVVPDVMDPDQFKRTKEEVQEAYSRDASLSQPGLLEGGMDFKEAGMSAREGLLDETIVQTMRMIAAGLGVDPALLGDNANKTYSNYIEAVRALIKLTSLPLLDWLIDQMNTWYMPRYGTPEAKLTYDESMIKALREDANEKVARLSKLVAGQAIFTQDEAREELGYDPKMGNAAELLSKIGTILLSDIGGMESSMSEEDEAAASTLLMEVEGILQKSTNGHH